jgi:hypothetical protein
MSSLHGDNLRLHDRAMELQNLLEDQEYEKGLMIKHMEDQGHVIDQMREALQHKQSDMERMKCEIEEMKGTIEKITN